jgi:hypothetical protein
MTPDTGEAAPLIDPDRPSLRTASRRPQRDEGMTGSLSPAPAGETRTEDVNAPLTHQPKAAQAPVDLPVLNSIRRTAPASRPCGRCAVGLRPSLDPDAYFSAP